MPAEWEPHRATWFTWPRPDGISFPGRFDVVPPVLADLFRQLLAVEEVHLNVWNLEMEQQVRASLQPLGVAVDQLQFHHFPSYEPWCRDHGPIFVVRERNGIRDRAVIDWAYNAWGGKYPPFDLDDAVPQHIAALRKLPLYSPGMILEGGSIDVNGQGALLTTEACLLNPNRNPQLDRAQIESHLESFLGVTNVLWLGDGIAGDDTDGHVDDLSRFVSPTTIVTVVEQDPQDENFSRLQENLKRLRSFRINGQPFRVVELPMPGRVEWESQRLPASYANFYIANQRVLVPTYRHPNDAKAIAILQREFPDRRVIGIDSTDLIWGLGSFHCLTQQEPRP